MDATKLDANLSAQSRRETFNFQRTNSLNEQQLSGYQALKQTQTQVQTSLPPVLNHVRAHSSGECSTPGGNASELNFQLHELKNRLLKSETDRLKLQQELENTITRNAELGQELQSLRDQLSQFNSLNQTDFAEGYGLGSLKSPRRLLVADKASESFAQLQEKARNLLSTPTHKQKSQEPNLSQSNNNDATVVLLQMIEDFCREGDKVVEVNKKDREDLQAQIDTADKQLKATRQFLEEQATEREQERDEFVREIERLKVQLRDVEKERSSYQNASEEVLHLETQISGLTQKLNESNAKRDKFEIELKASIDKIFDLREIIAEYEMQVKTTALNEHVLGEKVKQLEAFINTLQSEMAQSQSQNGEIDVTYQSRIRALEEKLQNMRPTAEQSMVLDQVAEQLRDIENALEQKIKTLESLHHSSTNNSNSCSISATEDVSVDATRPPTSLPATILSPLQGSPVHPSPRQHSFTMEAVQRIVEKLTKHNRVEEAAVKRIRDLEMQVTQLRSACVELQHERESLQDRMSEQTQRISLLQSRLEEQRQRAEELQRAGTSDLNIRIHDLQTELQNMTEKLNARDKQVTVMQQQLEKSRLAIERLEAELIVTHQPDHSQTERLEAELKQKCAELQKLKTKIKNEMINKLALPDLMETMLADKNEEIDHLKEQLEAKEKELSTALKMKSSQESAGKNEPHQLCSRSLSDIVSITELDEPDVLRRAAVNNVGTPLLLPVDSEGYMQQTMNSSKEAVANLTQKRIEDLSGIFAPPHVANTFDHPHYFQDPNMLLLASGKSGSTVTPGMVPRHINFSEFSEDSKFKTPILNHSSDLKAYNAEKELIKNLEQNIEDLKCEQEKAAHALKEIKEKEISERTRADGLSEELSQRHQEIFALKNKIELSKEFEQQIAAKVAEIERLLREQEELKQENKEKTALLTKYEKNLLNYQENEQNNLQRIAELEAKILKETENEMGERESLRKELQSLSEAHDQCKFAYRDAENRKQEIEKLNQEIKAKDERLVMLNTKLARSEEIITTLQNQITQLEHEVEKIRQQQQQNSENSSRQFSVDEIAQQVEKELNYSAQLDANILRAIESEEENNLNVKSSQKERQTKTEPQNTDDENFTGERDLLNKLEALRVQVAVEREQSQETRQELLAEKQHSQEIQEQDVLIIEAMRKRLETALEKEDELHKQLDLERERCERAQTQLTALQRAESRRNSALLLKSPTESPRKSPRSLNDFETELAERLRSEIKLLTAQNERERERSIDLQRSSDRERQRFDNELHERVDYCEKLKKEMEKLAREKESAEQESEHLQERLTLQTQEIESLESRLATLQEAETRRTTRRERQHKENAELLAELQEIKTQLQAVECERESLTKSIAQLRCDLERSAHREAKLAEALGNAQSNLADTTDAAMPQQFLEKMKEINVLLSENTQENRQMAETVQFLVEERRLLQKKCEEFETQLANTANVSELEERCNHLFGRYLRVESHRKALVYQKRYLKISLRSYQEIEQRALATLREEGLLQSQRNTSKLFKTVALAIIAINRMKYIGRVWQTGKRIVSKSVFTVTQQRRPQQQPNSTYQLPITTTSNNNINGSPLRALPALHAPSLVFTDYSGAALTTHKTYERPRSSASHS